MGWGEAGFKTVSLAVKGMYNINSIFHFFLVLTTVVIDLTAVDQILTAINSSRGTSSTAWVTGVVRDIRMKF